MRRKTRVKILAAGMIAVFGLSACQKSPDSSIIVNKDMDNLIDEARNGENGSSNVVDVAMNYDSYQATLQDASLGVTVNADARVDIPNASQMSVLRVKQAPISQELLTSVQQELMSGETLYDGAILSTATKAEIEEEIRRARAEMENIADQDPDAEVYREEIQSLIDEYQATYENAPAELVWGEYLSDGALHTVEELYQRDESNEFYSWEYSLNPAGDVYYGVNDGTDGHFCSLFAMNNAERGNCLRYRSSRHGYEFTAACYTFSSDLESIEKGADTGVSLWLADQEQIPDQIKMNYGAESAEDAFQEVTDETVTISKEKAVEMADAFLEKVGIEGFDYYQGGMYYEVLDIRSHGDTDKLPYRKEFVLSYMRKTDGAFTTFDAAFKHTEGWQGEDYVKKDWPVESIEFRITDDGIVGFDYNAPLQVVETVVEQSNMKSFEDIRSTFETMVMVTNAQDADPVTGIVPPVTIDIDRVVLGYTRISEADSYDTGLLIPVWDFKGTVHDQYYGKTGVGYGSVLTINAIDGSIIDRSLGY